MKASIIGIVVNGDVNGDFVIAIISCFKPKYPPDYYKSWYYDVVSKEVSVYKGETLMDVLR